MPKFSDLVALTSLAVGDLFAVVDVSDTTQGPTGSTKKITTTNLIAGLLIPVTSGGTGIAAGTSGGIPYFSGSTTIQSSGALALNSFLLGGGPGNAPISTTTGAGVVTAISQSTNSIGGLLTFGGSFTVGTLTTTGTLELGNASDTTVARASAGVISVEGIVIPSISSTNTFTNKALTKRVVTTTDDSTAVIDVAVTDVYELSAVANATTFSTIGSPVDAQVITLRWKDAGVTKGLTWDAIFVAIGVTLPTTTTASKWGYATAHYNSAASKFHVLAVGLEA